MISLENSFNYYEKTKNYIARKNVRKFVELKISPGKCIDLGCGAGNDTIFLIKNGWEVTAIDKNNTENIIRNYLNKEEEKKFKFQIQDFKNLSLNPCNLLVANYSLSFCDEKNFKNLWNKIVNSIYKNGYFVGNFFGKHDTWAKRPNMIFFTKKEVLNLFSSFEIINFLEIEKDDKTALGKQKHWHIFDIIAKKK